MKLSSLSLTCLAVVATGLTSALAFGAPRVDEQRHPRRYHSPRRISTVRYAVLQRFPIAEDGGWDYLSVDPDGHKLYISRGTHVQVMNTNTGRIVGDIANTSGVHGIALAPKLHKGFTSNGRDGTVTVFDTNTYREIARVKVGQGPDAIIFDPASNRVFTFNGRGGDSTAIDARTNSVVGTVPLDGRPEYPQPDNRGSIFVNIEDKSEVQQIDTKTLTTVKKWPLAPGDGPSGMAIDPKNHVCFSVCGNRMMVVSDTVAGRVVSTPVIGDGPDAAAFDPGTGYAFSSNGEGTLTVVQRDRDGSYSVAQTVTTQRSAHTMALDPKSHKIYLIAAEFSAPAAGERRGRVGPGSTVILVVGPAR